MIEAPAAPSAAPRTHLDASLIKTLGRAHRWRRALLAGKAHTFNDIARKQGCTNRYVRRVLNLSFLSPDIVDAILAGTQPRNMTVASLLTRDIPLSWRKQRVEFGFASAHP